MTIPNIITIVRLVVVPIVIVMILREQWALAFALFVFAGLSDAADGFIARRFDMRSEFGAVIDPLADKALLVSIYVTLAIADRIPDWLTVIVVSRDAMIVMAFMVSWMLAQPMAVRPLFISKVNTAAQIAFAALVLAGLAFSLEITSLVEVSTLVIATLTIVTAGAYLIRWLKHMAH